MHGIAEKPLVVQVGMCLGIACLSHCSHTYLSLKNVGSAELQRRALYLLRNLWIPVV